MIGVGKRMSGWSLKNYLEGVMNHQAQTLLTRKDHLLLQVRTWEQRALDLHAMSGDPRYASFAFKKELQELAYKLDSARKELEVAQVELHIATRAKGR